MFDSYVICTSPRSGSTLLCKLLTATGIAGKPDSYFYGPTLEECCTDLGVDVGTTDSEIDGIASLLQAALREGRGGTALFGFRQQASGLAFLCKMLAARYPQETTDIGRFQQAFGTTRFIYLSRPKIAQAVSLLKAEQSGLWHVAPDGSDLERVAPHNEPFYDTLKLGELVNKLAAYDQAWETWFLREGINPVRILYDDLAQHPAEILRQMLRCLGLHQAAANGVTPGVKRLADEVNRDWEVRFRNENGIA